MSAKAAVEAGSPPGRRCRPRGAAREGLRPTDVLAAFFLLGVAYLALAVLVGVTQEVTGWAAGRWLALHLAFIGGVSQLVLGASQFFVGAFLATDPPARALVRTQLGLWNAGTLLVALGVTFSLPAGAQAGGVALLAALALYARGLWQMQRRSLQRARWAARWYYVAAALLAPGLVAGVLLARGTAWTFGDLLGAHLVLNLGGWFGTAIVGTLHTFFPSLTATRLSFPRLEPWTFASWTAGVCALALGHAIAVPALALAGWSAMLVAAACLGANVLGSLRAAPTPLALPARLVAAAQAALIAGLLVAVAFATTTGSEALAAGSGRAAVAAMLLAGWIGLTVLGSLLHLLTVLLRVRAGFALPGARPARDRALVAAAGAGVAALAGALLLELGSAALAAAGVVLLVYALLAGQVLSLAVRAARATRPRL